MLTMGQAVLPAVHLSIHKWNDPSYICSPVTELHHPLGLVLMSHPSAVVGWVGLGGLVSRARLRVTLLICPTTTMPCRFNKWNILHTFGQFVQTLNVASGYHPDSHLWYVLQHSQSLSAVSIHSGVVAEVLPVPTEQWCSLWLPLP